MITRFPKETPVSLDFQYNQPPESLSDYTADCFKTRARTSPATLRRLEVRRSILRGGVVNTNTTVEILTFRDMASHCEAPKQPSKCTDWLANCFKTLFGASSTQRRRSGPRGHNCHRSLVNTNSCAFWCSKTKRFLLKNVVFD